MICIYISKYDDDYGDVICHSQSSAVFKAKRSCTRFCSEASKESQTHSHANLVVMVPRNNTAVLKHSLSGHSADFKETVSGFVTCLESTTIANTQHSHVACPWNLAGLHATKWLKPEIVSSIHHSHWHACAGILKYEEVSTWQRDTLTPWCKLATVRRGMATTPSNMWNWKCFNSGLWEKVTNSWVIDFDREL